MKSTFQYKYLYIFLILLGLHACQKEVKLKSSEYTDKLVAHALFTQDTIISVKVNRSRGVTDPSNDFFLDNADIIVYGPNNFSEKLIYNPFNDLYETSFKPEAGVRYRLQVSASDFNTMNADGMIPGNMKLFAFTYKDSVSFDSDGAPEGELTISFHDEAVEENYYIFSIQYYSASINEYFAFAPEDAEINNPGLERNNDNTFMLPDQNFNGHNHVIRFKVPFGQVDANTSPKFMLEFLNSSKDYYLYKKSVTLNDNSLGIGLFTEPVQIYTNFNTGLGIFAGANLLRDTIQ